MKMERVSSWAVAIVKACTIILAIGGIIIGCATNRDSYMQARHLDTVVAYEAFLKDNPDSPQATEAKNRIRTLKEEASFREVEHRNSKAAYQEFIEQNPGSKLVEEARKRRDQTDKEALVRTLQLGTKLSFQGFLGSYPKSVYIPEVRDRIQWMENKRIAVVTKTLDEESKRNVRAALSQTTHEFKTECIEEEADLGGGRFSAVVDIQLQRRETNPDYVAKQATQVLVCYPTVLFGIVGLIVGEECMSALNPGSPNAELKRWSATVLPGQLVGNVDYGRRDMNSTNNLAELLSGQPYHAALRDADFIAWLVNRAEFPMEIARLALNAEDFYLREATVKAIGEKPLPRLELLLEALKDKEGSVRKITVEQLGKVMTPEVTKPLIAALRDDYLEVKIEAARALGRIRDPSSVQPLIEVLADDTPELCIAAADSLGALGDPQAISPLIGVFSDEQPYVRTSVATALKKITGKDFGEDKGKWLEWYQNSLQPLKSGTSESTKP